MGVLPDRRQGRGVRPARLNVTQEAAGRTAPPARERMCWGEGQRAVDLRSTALRMSAGPVGHLTPGLSRSPRYLVPLADRSGGSGAALSRARFLAGR